MEIHNYYTTGELIASNTASTEQKFTTLSPTRCHSIAYIIMCVYNYSYNGHIINISAGPEYSCHYWDGHISTCGHCCGVYMWGTDRITSTKESHLPPQQAFSQHKQVSHTWIIAITYMDMQFKPSYNANLMLSLLLGLSYYVKSTQILMLLELSPLLMASLESCVVWR